LLVYFQLTASQIVCLPPLRETSRPHTDLVNLEAGTAQYWASDEAGMLGAYFATPP
jgi:hypothetical protein